MADKDDKREPELEPVGPGADMEPEDQTVRDVEGEDIRDDRDDDEDRTARGRHQDEEDGEERAGHAEQDEEDGSGDDRERIRARRRAERRAKKEENRRNQRELNFLRTRNEQLEKRQSEFDARMANTEVVTIDTRIQALEADIRKADDVYAEAISKGDGQSAAEAQRIRDTLRDEVMRQKGARNQTIAGARERLQGNQNRPDPGVQMKAQEWMSQNPWYDHQGGNEDSLIAKAVDAQLTRERGIAAARTDAYWDEYDRRLRKRLPHVFKKDREDDEGEYEETGDRDIDEHNRRHGRRDADDDRDVDEDDDRDTRRNGRNGRSGRGGPRFTSGGRERPLKKNEVYVSEERRKAMEEAGVWEDPVTRNRYLKQYAKYDAEARRNRR